MESKISKYLEAKTKKLRPGLRGCKIFFNRSGDFIVNRIKRLFNFFIWALIFGTTNVISLDVSNSNNSPARSFAFYIRGVAEVLRMEEVDNANFLVGKALALERMISNIENLFALQAFSRNHEISENFQNLFKDINYNEWPTCKSVRSWKKKVNKYKQLVLSKHFSSSNLNEQEVLLNYKATDAILVLCMELEQNIFTDDFFKFTILDRILDTSINRPIEFAKKHPFLCASGAIVLCLAAYGVHYSMNKSPDQVASACEEVEKEVEPEILIEEEELALNEQKNKNPKKNVVVFVRGSQDAAECGLNTLYKQWCHQKAPNDCEKYTQLTLDKKLYGEFKLCALGFLKGKKLPKDVLAGSWLENDHMHTIIKGLRSIKKGKFKLKVGERNPYFVDSIVNLNPDRIENLIYRDRERVDRDGDPICYGNEEELKEAERSVDDCEIVKRGLRYEKGTAKKPCMKEAIDKFQLKDGNKFDFIVNTNKELEYIPGYEPARRGHYFHVRAVRDSNAKDGIRFIVSDSMKTNPKIVKSVLDNIKFLLRPF